MICIYCLRDIAKTGYSSREHVIPEAFGRFSPNNLTLKFLVFDGCNRYFGQTIDLKLARGGIEALDRLTLGIKPPEEVGDIRRDRIQLRLAQEGKWKGIILELKADPRGQNGLVVDPIPQVGFARKAGEGFIFVSEEILKDDSVPLPNGIDHKKGLLIIVDTDNTKSRIIEILKSRNIDFNEKQFIPSPYQPGENLLVMVQSSIDKDIRRCVAKIAFNYLSYTQEKYYGLEQARKFILHNDFFSIREFIRYGRDATYPLLLIDSLPILGDDTPTARQTNGHLVTVNWTSDKANVVAQVSLFNRLRYRISLARNFSGIYRPIRSGHLFDIENKKIKKLVASPRFILDKL